MNTHDVLAYSLAREAVHQMRMLNPVWSGLFSPTVFVTASRAWPVPDFVIVDPENSISLAAEFKPPNQSKREYLTGLGQAIAYTASFHYALLIVPEVSDDNYPIATYIDHVLTQDVASNIPVGLLRYDPRTISPTVAQFEVIHPLVARSSAPTTRVSIDQSFWAKWRDISPMELGLLLEYLYEEGRPQVVASSTRTIRDRAFDRLWNDMQSGRTRHWSGGVRRPLKEATKVGWGKNYRNFITHIGLCLSDGKLTEEGLRALRIVHQYGSDSRLFFDELSLALLLGGKHLVLINAINEFQDAYIKEHGPFPDEQTWLDEVETHLDTSGYLTRNPGRHGAAVQQVKREFLKAEKTLWRNLEFFVPSGPRGGRAYHPGRGFVFNWARITSLLS